MKVEFTREEVEETILEHANRIVQTGDRPFNKVKCDYSHIPQIVAVVRDEPKEEAA
jgi:hypothetical protein